MLMEMEIGKIPAASVQNFAGAHKQGYLAVISRCIGFHAARQELALAVCCRPAHRDACCAFDNLATFSAAADDLPAAN